MRSTLGRSSAILLAAAMALTASYSAAQTISGTVEGTIEDSQGGRLPGVAIELRSTETGQLRTTVTNGQGFYRVSFVPIGRYRLATEISGFGRKVREIDVRLNSTSVVDLALSPALAEEVVVTVDAPRINTTSGALQSSLTSEQIMEKPTVMNLNNVNQFLSLAETFAGFQENPTSGQNNPTTSSGSSINFNGTGSRGATFQINGVNNDDSSENQNRQGASLSTIKEFQVISNTFSAEFGRGYGAVVLVQTKSGTNKWHGDAYSYLQDSTSLTALRKFATLKPDNQRHQYGGTAGFPITKNKLFAFVSVDRTKFQGTQNYARDLFLASELAAPRLTRGNDTPANRKWIGDILARYPQNVTPNDPRSNRTYATVVGFNWPDEDSSGRLDWQLGRNAIVGRYQYTHQLRQTDDVILGEQARQDNGQQNLGVTWTRVFRNSIVGEFRYGLGVRNTLVDIASGNDTPIVRFTASPVSGTILGNSGGFPIHRDQRDHQFVYNLSWMLGRNHTLKAGTDIRRQALDDLADNFSRGFWTFNRVCGGVTYATPYDAFLDGCVASYQRAWGPFYLENRINESNFYAEDRWRPFPSLTVSAGLRYEYVSAPTEIEKRIDYLYKNDRNNLEPRLGGAWALPPTSGFFRWLTGRHVNAASLRGGFGRTDGRIFQSVFSQNGASVRSNLPNALARTTTTQPGILNIADPTLGFVFVPGPQVGRVSLVLPDPHLEMPATKKWNISVDRIMPFNSTLKISYEANHNDKRLRYAQNNLPLSPVYGPVTVVDHPNNAPAAGFPDLRGKTITRIAADVACAGTGFFGIATTTACPNAVPIADNEISVRVPRTNERRPNPLYTTNLFISNDAESWYKGLEIEWAKRLSRGLQFQAAYTYSKSEDTTSEATFVGAGDTNQNGPNKQFAKGLSRFHTPHRFTFNGSYRLPFFAARTDMVGQVLGGWQLSGVMRLVSGTPFSVIDSSVARDIDFDGFNETSRAAMVDKAFIGAHVSDPDTAQATLPRSAFRSVDFTDTFDNISPRNGFYAPGTRNVDLALAKNFRTPWQGHNFSVRIEAYNAFNIVKFGFPVNDIANVNFGRLLGAATSYSPRVVQLTLRYRY